MWQDVPVSNYTARHRLRQCSHANYAPMGLDQYVDSVPRLDPEARHNYRD